VQLDWLFAASLAHRFSRRERDGGGMSERTFSGSPSDVSARVSSVLGRWVGNLVFAVRFARNPC